MSDATLRSAQGSPWRPWSQAWIDVSPVGPFGAGLAFAAAHVLSGCLFYLAIVTPVDAGSLIAVDALGAMIIFGLLIGYGPAALAIVRRGHRATLEELRPSLRCSDEELTRAREEIERFQPALLRTVGIVVVVLSPLATLFTTGLIDELGPRNPLLIWIVWQNALAFWLTSRTIAHDLRGSRLLSRFAQEWADIELLDLTPFAPLARRGLQSALVIVLGSSIATLIYTLGNLSPAVPLLQALTLALAGLALVLPSLGVHGRLRVAKREELERLAAQIRAARAEPSDPGGLASLLTLRQHVESARDWPFDLGTLGRFGLYAAIGLGSWLGGALVERLVEAAIG